MILQQKKKHGFTSVLREMEQYCESGRDVLNSRTRTPFSPYNNSQSPSEFVSLPQKQTLYRGRPVFPQRRAEGELVTFPLSSATKAMTTVF